MAPEERLRRYEEFASVYLSAVREYTKSRPNQRSKAPWQVLVDTGLNALQDIPANEFAPKAYWLLKAYPELERQLVEITDFLPEDSSLVEREYCVYHGLTARPNCKHCGVELVPPSNRKFRFVESKGGKSKAGYGDYCGIKCGSAAEETVTKRKATNLERRGVEVPSQCEEVREKMRTTTRRKHGEDSFARTESFREGSRRRNMAKYGVEAVSPFEVEQVRGKSRDTLQERYGVDNAMGVQSFADKAGDGRRRYTYAQMLQSDAFEPCFPEHEYFGVMKNAAAGIPYRYLFRCKSCGDEFLGTLEHKKHRRSSDPVCPVCNPASVSAGEAGLLQAITGLSPDLTVIHRDYEVLRGHPELDRHEIDVMVQETQTGVEFNGLYWHSEFAGGKGENYHQRKLDCLMEAGKRLIHVWEDEWQADPELIEARVALACSTPREVPHGECSVSVGKEYQPLMGRWHRDGSLGGHASTYCLLHCGAPVAVMQVVFRPSKRAGVPGKSAVRYAPVGSYRVAGDLSVLFREAQRAARGKDERVFYADVDPSFDDIAAFHDTGFRMVQEKSKQQWYCASPYRYNHRLSKTALIERVRDADPTMNTKTTMTDARLQAVGADRIWGVKRQVWEYHHTPS